MTTDGTKALDTAERLGATCDDVISLDARRIIEERDIGFDGSRGGRWEIILVESAQDRLGTKDENISISGDIACRTQDVGELQPLHAVECSWSQCSRNDRSAWRRSASESTPANGLFWRSSMDASSVPVSTSTTSSTPPSRTFCHCLR